AGGEAGAEPVLLLRPGVPHGQHAAETLQAEPRQGALPSLRDLTQDLQARPAPKDTHTHTLPNTHTQTHTYTHTHKHSPKHTDTRADAHTRTHKHTRAHTHTHTHTHTYNSSLRRGANTHTHTHNSPLS